MRRRPGPPVRHTKPPGKAVVKSRRKELEASIPKRWQRFERKTVQEAYEIGTELNELKALTPRGEWLPWVKAYMPAQTAQRLMKLAREYTSNTQIADATSVKEALALLAAPAAEAASEVEADVELDEDDVIEEGGEQKATEWTWGFIKEQSRPALIRIIIDYEVDIDTGKAGDKATYKLDKLQHDVAIALGVEVPKADRPKRKSSSDVGGTGKIDYKNARVKKPGKKEDEPEPEREPIDTSNPYGDADAYEDDYDDEVDTKPEPAVRDRSEGRDTKVDDEDDLWAWYEPTIEFLSDFNNTRRTFTYAKVDERELLKFLRKDLGFSKSDAEARINQLRFDGVLLDDGATLYRRLS